METPASSLTHAWIWAAIDELARRNDLSPSGLARLAGLDPTCLNRSKRTTGDGRLRWPSTESIAKILDATGTSLNAFAELQVSFTDKTQSTTRANSVISHLPEKSPQDPAARSETDNFTTAARTKRTIQRA